MDSMRLHSLTVVSDDDIDITFIGDDGTLVTHRFFFRPRRDEVPPNGLYAVFGDNDFIGHYRRCPGPLTPRWPERLAGMAHQALLEPLPAGPVLEQMRADELQRSDEAWNARHQSPE